MAFFLISAIAVALVIAVASWLNSLIGRPAAPELPPLRQPENLALRRDHRPAPFVTPVPMPVLEDAAKTASRPVNSLTFDLIYRDANGEVSARRIDIEEVSRNFDAYYIEAWCHLRRAGRSFRVDRIIELASAETGEVMRPPVEGLRRYIREQNDPGPDFGSVIGKAKKGLAVLIWIARADNDISEREADILVAYIFERDAMGARSKGERVWKEAAARSWIDYQRPTMEDAAGARATMAFSGKEDALCARFIEQLVACQPEDTAGKVAGRAKRLGYALPEVRNR